jgi:hypothetical protein
MTGNCTTCGKGYPDVQVDTYYGANGATRICDPCLFAEIRAAAPQPTVAYAADARYFVDAQGRESELPSYGS